MVVVNGLAKKLGAIDCAGAGTVVEDVGAGVGVANKFFAGSLVSVVVKGEVKKLITVGKVSTDRQYKKLSSTDGEFSCTVGL